ncbi:AAA family ATPase [Xanthomonas nasturtii]|uniref:AAA family ATPase n=1 Tax=Xanthomonas nasturtii TaxID=1843581 RepID=UPI0020129C06|nr:AAA family ATPase [Xanthomonas nasturtii]MCL1504549.1 AAA family ATPase [Xanthomonas nasturtii]MCL1523575.1 AAA family ATPase [Xanthomonas nasturtii]MCL1525959.1 AAA family ATPase [Xanthomonas nasturtii]MCL1559293.1 AAA family ATPase [Xanthomonas nasturtii]
MQSAALVVFGGLPGVGKSSIAQALLTQCTAFYLRIDTIEQALRDSGALANDVGPAGYMTAYALAEANLQPGHVVVADCVNPLPVTREAWRDVARRTRSRLLEIEVVCSDRKLHRQRVESRRSDVVGLRVPDWSCVLAHEYVAWAEPHWVIDSAGLNPQQAATQIMGRLGA